VYQKGTSRLFTFSARHFDPAYFDLRVIKHGFKIKFGALFWDDGSIRASPASKSPEVRFGHFDRRSSP
jgi:hypothetical protein